MNSLFSSRLYDNKNFYKAFEKDLKDARHRVLIESPFITARRMNDLLPILRKLRRRGVGLVVNTRHPAEHDDAYQAQVETAIENLQDIGATVLFTGGHHRKLAIIDDEVLWEGSLNILSQNDSCEIMRRTVSQQLADEMVRFIGVGRWL
jgi:phosphatidylserine/phosphatidylglycerophosphate/cardiolipin synthase-like enzyme